MLNGTIDLHLHSICSDGKDTPEELVEASLGAGYRTISITDHDSVEGVPRAIESAKGKHIEIIPGIELSSVDDSDDVHILGYYIDYKDNDFLEQIAFFKEKRAFIQPFIVFSIFFSEAFAGRWGIHCELASDLFESCAHARNDPLYFPEALPRYKSGLHDCSLWNRLNPVVGV